MGENHKENLLKCLTQWHDITLKQHEVLATGDIEQFERLNRVSITLQSRFGNSLEKLGKPVLTDHERKLLEEINEYQSRFIEELNKGIQEMAKAIGSLRKNKASLSGYRQKSSAPPRFKNERT